MADACDLRLVVRNSFLVLENSDGVACGPKVGRSRSLSEGHLELSAGKFLVEEDSCGELSESTADASDLSIASSEDMDAEAMAEAEDEVVCLDDEEPDAARAESLRPPGVWASDPCFAVSFVTMVPCQESAAPEKPFARRRRGVRGGKRRFRNRALGDGAADDAGSGLAGRASASWADLSEEGDEC